MDGSVSSSERSYKLLREEFDKRDDPWWEELATVIGAAHFVFPSEEPVTGSDGHQYVVAFFEGAQKGVIRSFEDATERALESGVGIVVQEQDGKTLCIFPYGTILSYKLYKEFYKLNPAEPPPSAGESEPIDGTVTVPEETFLPREARKAIAAFMREDLGIEVPLFLAVLGVETNVDPLLGFNIFPEDFAEEGEFDSAMSGLSWFLPSHYDLIVVTEDSALGEAFTELEPLEH